MTMRPLYAARVEDLGLGDLVKVDCAACNHTALLGRDALVKVGIELGAKLLDLRGSVRCRSCGARGRLSCP